MLNDLLFSANVIVPIFLLILLGYGLTRLKLWDAHFLKIANDLCFKVLLPVLLFYNVATANIFEVFNGKLILYACGCACTLCGVLFLIVPLFVKDNKRRGVMIQGTFRSNFLLFGVPLGLSIGGERGAILAVHADDKINAAVGQILDVGLGAGVGLEVVYADIQAVAIHALVHNDSPFGVQSAL